MDSRAEATVRRAGRFVAPARAAIDPQVWRRQPLSTWEREFPWLKAERFPEVAELNRCWPQSSRWQFAEQSSELLADGLHYEERIAHHGVVATRADNWHDLFNALIWLRHFEIKTALNARQAGEIAHMGPKTRSRAQCALTHFDEAGVIVLLRDPSLLALWDAHDWHGLFWRERAAWRDGRIGVEVFGHALLEHALSPHQLLVGKALAVQTIDCSNACTKAGTDSLGDARALSRVARAIAAGEVLSDPQELRPLPLSGIPGWHPGCDAEEFYESAACFRPLRPGRCYPAPLGISMGLP